MATPYGGRSTESARLAVALNRGMGSSSLNADVNAFENLQIVRGRNSAYLQSAFGCLVVFPVNFGAHHREITP